MLSQSKTFNKVVGFILLATILSACSSKVEKASGGSVATFFVDNIDGSSVVSKVDSTYSIPEARLYNFKACVKDIMQSKSIQGQSFKIQGGDVEKVVNTDEQGCLNWSETISFNFLAQSNYIQLTRTITANGIHKGSTNIDLVLNPWSHGEDTTGVIDPTKKTISSLVAENQSMSALVSEGTRSPLWAIGPRVTILEKEFTSSGASMSLKFQTKLSLILKSTTLQKVQYQINNGVFDVEMFLYNSVTENGVETITPLASSTLNSVGFTQDTLIAEFPFNLNVLPNKGQILMGIKITAPNNEVGLDPFEGIYMVSDNSNIKIDGAPTVAQDLSFQNIKSKINDKLGSSNKSKDNKTNVLAKPGVEIDKLDIKFFKLGSESTTDRQVFFNVKACMKSNLDGRPIRDENFTVKTVSSKTLVTLKSNQDGCVSWDDFIWHKFFGKEQFVKTAVVISNENFNLKNQITIMLNPWDTGSNFGRDGRFVDDLGSVAVNPSSENAKISIDNYGFSVSSYGYDINKNLDLSLIKNGTLSLSAKVVNHSSLSYGRMGYESLRDGKYLLKWAVVTIDQNQKLDSLISNGQKVVSVFGGDVKTDVGFKVSAFEKLNIRSRLVVALYTLNESKLKSGAIEVDRNSGLEATPYMATIILSNDQDSQKMQLIDNNLGLGKGDVFERIASVSLPAAMSDYTAKVLAGQNLKKINLSNEKESQALRDGLANPKTAYYHEGNLKPALSSQVLADFAKTGKLSTDLASKFCEYWFNDYFKNLKPESKSGALIPNVNFGMTQTCLDFAKRDPSKFFAVDKKIMVKKVSGFKYLSGTTTNFSVGNSFSVSKSDTSSKSQTWSWTTTAGLSFEFLDVFKVGTSGSYALSSSKSKTDSTSSGASVNASTYLFLQASTFNVDIASYEECSSIRLNPELFIGKNARYGAIWNETMKPAEIAKAATGGYFICTGVTNNSPITKKETYYLVSQDTGSSKGEQDAYSAENHQFFMTFRGQKDLMSFLGLIQSSVQMPGSANSFDATKGGLSSRFAALPTWPSAYSDLN